MRKKIGRRTFFKAAAVVGAGAAADAAEKKYAEAKKASEKSKKPKSGRRKKEAPKGKESGRRRFMEWLAKLSPVERTAIEQPLITVGTAVASTIQMDSQPEVREAVRKSGKELRKSLEESGAAELQKKPLFKIISNINFFVTQPAIEEAAFRLAPSKIINTVFRGAKGKNAWIAGMPISALFAKIHTYKYPKELRNKIIPWPQFLMGSYWWYLMRKRGYSHAFMAHAANNLLLYFFVYARYKLKGKKAKEPKYRINLKE